MRAMPPRMDPKEKIGSRAMPEMQVGLSECSAPQARRGESGTPLATPALAGAGWLNSGAYVRRLEPRPFQHLQHPGAIPENVLRGNRHRSLELRCSEAPAFSVIARGTVNQASRYVVAIPPSRLCRPLSIERLSVRIEDLSASGLAIAQVEDWRPRTALRRNRFCTSSQSSRGTIASCCPG